ncbi:hypothetical protein [Natrinema marinum]|uniref:hypothetical protein n=1 Tax=Natrinema marinum TaxID=2961598 RepID=UPI0020C8A6C5|nr:hypothetical protein [Natrinema marinum]
MSRRDDAGPLERTGEEPFASGTPDGERGGRSVDWAALSHALTPTRLRHRALAVTVSTNKRRYERGEPVAITVEFRNRLPVPLRLRTESPIRWTWAVDGDREASREPPALPDRPTAFDFARRERKHFRRQWSQRIRVAEDEWVPVDAGSYTITVRLTRDDAADRGLVDRTEIVLER